MQLCTPLFKPLALSVFLLTVLPAPTGFITSTRADTLVRVNGQGLLGGLHRSLATIVVAYDQKPPSQRSRADALMLDGAREAATELGHLKSAIADRDGRRMAISVRKMSVAIGRLQGTYRMACVNNSSVAEGLRALEANWAAFTAHYALSRSSPAAKSVAQAQLNELKDRVSSLESELRRRRARASDPVALRELDSVYVEIERINRRPMTVETYQSTLLSLSFVTGTMTGYVAVSAIYYPQFHDYWVEEVDRSSFYYEGHWDAYYQGYYDGLAEGFLDSSFSVPETVNVHVDQSVNQQVDIYVTQEINVLVDQAQNSVAEYSNLPVSAADVAGEFVPPAIDDPVAAAERMAVGDLQGGDEPAFDQPQEAAGTWPAGTDTDTDRMPFEDVAGDPVRSSIKSGDLPQDDDAENDPSEPQKPKVPAFSEQASGKAERADENQPENQLPERSTEEAPSRQEIDTARQTDPAGNGQGDRLQENADEDPSPWRKANR